MKRELSSLKRQYFRWLSLIAKSFKDGEIREFDIDHWLRESLLGTEQRFFITMANPINKFGYDDYVAYLEQVRGYMSNYGITLPEIEL